MNPRPVLQSRLRRRLRVAGWALWRRLQGGSRCPSCGGRKGTIIGHAHLLLAARRCAACGLVYRLPTKLVPGFYDEFYHPYTVWWRELSDGSLARTARQGFRGTKWDYYDKLSLLQAVKPSGRVLDYGGGSGIITWQLRDLGYDAELLEICTGLREISVDLLGLNTFVDVEELLVQRRGAYDMVLLHHVLEHLDDLPAVFRVLDQLLKPDGLLVLFAPNHAARVYAGVGAATLDSAHVCAFDAAFFARNMERFGVRCVTFSTPYAFSDDGALGQDTYGARGKELAVFAWRIDQPTPVPLARVPHQMPDLRDSVRAQLGY